MYARRIAQSSLKAPIVSFIRPFTSTGLLARSPALADVTPNGARSFEAKREEFKQRLIEDQKNRRKKETG